MTLTGFDLCRAAMAVTGITAPEKSVLMVLAIMADRDDATCFPPINGDTGLTAKTCLSERAVQRAIQRLKELGHISRRQLRHGCIYTVHPVTDALTPATVTGVTETPVSLTPVTQPPRPVSVAPKQPVTTNTSPVASQPTRSRERKAPLETFLPANFRPEVKPNSITGAAMAEWPPGEVERQLEHFTDHHTAKRTKSADWQASWRTWVKNWRTFSGNRTGRLPARQPDLRGSRPDPALDMFRASRAAQAACGTADYRGDYLEAGPAVSALEWRG